MPSFTPMTMVMSSPLAGAEMMTFLAPAAMVALGLFGVGEEAGGLDDECTPSLPQGNSAGVLAETTRCFHACQR